MLSTDRHPFLQHCLLWLVGGLVVLIAVMPASVLPLIGWDYALIQGVGVMKIHPTTYLAVLLLGGLVLFHWSEGNLNGGYTKFVPVPILIYIACILAILMFLTIFHGGGNISFMIDTLLMPGILLILLRHLTVPQQATLFRVMVILFVINVAIAILETLTGKRLFPFTVQGVEVLYDRRPTALLGHPLTNAHLTAVMIFLVLGCLLSKSGKVLVGSFLAVGLIAFGGRSAMVLFALCYIVYIAIVFWLKALRRQLTWGDLALLSGGAAFAPVPIVLIFAFTPFGQMMLERMTWDDSAASRIALFGIFRYLSPVDLLTGIPIERFNVYLFMLNMPWTIENAWVQLLVRFGLVFFALFLWALYRLFRFLAEDVPLEGVIALGLFLLIASTNNSLAGKGNLLSVTVSLVITGKAYRAMRQPLRDLAGFGDTFTGPLPAT
jgi:hypothetical protein